MNIGSNNSPKRKQNKMKLLISLLFACFAFTAYADTPPSTNIFNLRGGGQTGVVKVDNGLITPLAGTSSGDVLTWNGLSWVALPVTGTGTVTSVALSLPSIFNVTGSPVTTSGTLAGALANQSINTVFAGPASGPTGVPNFRSLVSNDIPSLTSSKISDFDSSVSSNTDVSANTAARHSAVTLGTANGLSLSTQQLSLGLSSTSTTGALSNTDWNTFNGKQATLTPGSISTSTTGVSVGNGANSTVGPNVTLNVQTASGSQPGLLSAADWSTFNSKQASLTFGSITSSTTGVSVGSGTSSTVGPNVTVNVQTASGSQPGLLSAADWATFNAKEPAIAAGTTSQYYRGDKSFQTLNTLAVSELTNLYYTDPRVQTLAKNQTPAQEFYVTKDIGNDANDCSIFKPCKTIQAGLNAAAAISAYYKQTIVHVAPASGGTGSSYNENITFAQQGINLVCDVNPANVRACLISGMVTINMTGTTGGANFVAALNESYMSGFVVTVTGANDAVTFSGSTYQRFIATNCYFDDNGSGSSAVISNSGTSGGTKSTFISYDSTFNNSNATNPTIALSNGRFWMFGTQPTVANGNASGKSLIQSGAASSFVCNLCAITGQAQITDNTANATFNLATIASGTAACVDTPASPSTGIITLAYFGCTSTNTNSVTGSGVVFSTPGSVRLSTSGDIVSTVTQAVVPGLPQGELMLGAGATTGTNVLLSIRGGHVKAAQATAPTATVNANAGTGATCTLSNASDVAGKINLTTTATAPASGIQCTVTFNKTYGVAPICTVTPSNNNSVLFAVANGVFFTTTTTTLLVNYANSDTLGHANVFMFHCLESQ